MRIAISGRHGAEARRLVPKLLEIARSREPARLGDRLAAVRAIGHIGGHDSEVVPFLIEQIETKHTQISSRASEAIAIYGKAASAAAGPLILSFAESSSMQYAAKVAGILDKICDDPIVELEKYLEHENFWVRRSVGFAMAEFPAAAYPQLRENLDSSEVANRVNAAGALRRLKGEAADAIPRLLELVDDPNPEVCGAALWAIADIDPDQVELIAKLRKILRSDERKPYLAAVYLLDAMGPAAEPAIPELVHALGSRHGEAMVGLRRIFRNVGEPAVEPLVDALNDPRRALAACMALGHMGKSAKSAIPALERLSESSDDENVRKVAKTSIDRIAP